MENIPGAFLRDVQIPTQLMRGNTLLMAADKIHCHEPFLQREFGILKDSTNKAGETLMAITTLELVIPIGTCIDMDGATERTNYHFMPTLFSNEITVAFLAIEMVSKCNDGVEVFEFKFHSLGIFIYLYLKTMVFLRKSPDFFVWTSIIYEDLGVN